MLQHQSALVCHRSYARAQLGLHCGSRLSCFRPHKAAVACSALLMLQLHMAQQLDCALQDLQAAIRCCMRCSGSSASVFACLLYHMPYQRNPSFTTPVLRVGGYWLPCLGW
jgi:hypothetical protein